MLVSSTADFPLNFYDRPFFNNDTTVFAVCGTDLFNLNNIFPNTDFTLNWATLNPNATDTGTYRLMALDGNACADTVNVRVTLEVAVWKGTTSSSWHTPANWSTGKIPTAITHVIVPSGTPNPCIISTANAAAASVQVKAAGIFNIINNQKLLIAGSCNALPKSP